MNNTGNDIMTKRITLFAAFFFLITNISLQSQIAIYPTATFIDPRSRTGSMDVANTSNEMREIKIKLRFGYHTYDSLGNPIMEYADSLAAKEYSLKPYLKVFPSKLMIPPKEQATIRFMVRGLPQGGDKFYWTRIIASSVPEVPQIDTVGEGKVAAQIIIQTDMIGLVGMLKGKNTADLDYDLADVFTDTTKLILLMKQTKTGNSPFWGIMYTKIYDSSDELVAEAGQGLAVYFSCLQRLAFDRDKFKPGKYTAKITINNSREEIPEEYLPEPANKFKEFEFEVK